jgi:hypothetical protein
MALFDTERYQFMLPQSVAEQVRELTRYSGLHQS